MNDDRFTSSGVHYKKKWSDRTQLLAWKQPFLKSVKPSGSLTISNFNLEMNCFAQQKKSPCVICSFVDFVRIL